MCLSSLASPPSSPQSTSVEVSGVGGYCGGRASSFFQVRLPEASLPLTTLQPRSLGADAGEGGTGRQSRGKPGALSCQRMSAKAGVGNRSLLQTKKGRSWNEVWEPSAAGELRESGIGSRDLGALTTFLIFYILDVSGGSLTKERCPSQG